MIIKIQSTPFSRKLASMLLRAASVGVVVFSLSACTLPGAVIWCVDSKIPRSTTNRNFSFVIYDTGGSAISSAALSCLKHYDSNCSERGNHYRYEQLSVSGDTHFITQLENGGSIEFTYPSCKNLLTEGEAEYSHFGRRYIDPVSSERLNNMFYAYEGSKMTGNEKLHEGYYYLDEKRRPIYLGLPFTFKVSNTTDNDTEISEPR